MVDMQATLKRNRNLLNKRKLLQQNPYVQKLKEPLITNYTQLKEWRRAREASYKQMFYSKASVFLWAGIVALIVILLL